MIDIISVWVWLGTINLAILTYQDMRKMVIDDRYNWLMYGANSIFIGIIKPNLLFILLSLVFAIGINVLWAKLKFKNGLAQGDISALVWIGIACIMIDTYAAVWFYGFFICATFIYIGLKEWVFKAKQALPFFPVILASFVGFCLVFGLY
jgi:hypothetical protein